MSKVCVGIDIIEIERINQAINTWKELFLNRVFTSEELSYCQKKVESLAVRFAAKEAVVKAIGADFLHAGWKDIEILNSDIGTPIVCLHRGALHKAKNMGLSTFSISLSHCKDYAVAICYAD